jgi:hypothetical protein
MGPSAKKDPPGNKPDNSVKPKPKPKPASGPENIPDLTKAGKKR